MNSRPNLPPWAETIRRKYLGEEASVFVLHLNVFDHILHEGRYYSLPDFLGRVLLWDNKRNILSYDPASGVSIIKEGDKRVVPKALPNRTPADVLPALEDVLFNSDSTAVLLTYAGTLVPAGSMAMLSEQDRINVVTVHRWSLSPQLNAKDNAVFIITDALAEVHPMLVANPKIAAIEVPMPDLATRRAVITKSDPSISEHDAEVLAQHTAGLKSVQIASLLTPLQPDSMDDEARREFILGVLGDSKDAAARADKLAGLTRGMTRDEIRHLIAPDSPDPVAQNSDGHAEILELVHKRKREIIEKECHGLIEFVDAKHDFSAVGGNEAIKEELLQIAQNIRAGQRNRVPMGLLFVGPMGSGKTFVAGAFANASGLSAVKLKNIRSKWVGATEANLEKVLSLVRALGPIILIIDEGDRALGGGGGDGDGGTSSRVIARLKEFMSDPENRGQVLSIIMTNRPDKIDVDMKRAGRLDRKIPFFYPYQPQEVEAVLSALFERYGIATTLDWERDRAQTSARLVGYSNADLEALVLLAYDMAARTPGATVTPQLLQDAIADYLPPRDFDMLEFMELLAVFEASRRSMLPDKYRDLSPQELSDMLTQKRAALRL